MLSVVVAGPRRIALEERALPEPGAGELRVRVRYAGICGSDVHILHGDNPFVVYPRVIGHEFVGTVERVGPGADAGRVGQFVAVDPVIGCGTCYPCTLGRSNVCRRLQVLGVHRDGGFSQWQCVPAGNAHPIPAQLSRESAATIEPFAIAANVTSRTGVLPSDVALVYGAGSVGLCVLQVLKGVHGVRVLVIDRIPERLALARRSGADEVIDASRESVSEALERLGLGDPTLVIDAVCHPSILEEAIRIASPAGRIGLLSFGSVPSAVSQQEVTRKELSLFASRLNSAMFPRVIEWMSRGQLHPERLITHRVDFREVGRAFELLEGDPRGTCKVLLDFGDESA